jgi:hypothetical protein
VTDIRAALVGRLPVGDANGLNAVAAELAKDPTRLRVGVILFDVEDVDEKIRKGYTAARVSIRRIEVVRDPADAGALQRILMREFERRTGATVLPIELEEEVEAAFADLDPATVAEERAEREQAEGPVEHQGATEGFADELHEMAKDLGQGRLRRCRRLDRRARGRRARARAGRPGDGRRRVSPVTMTVDGAVGFAARLDAATVARLHPAVVDEWLIDLKVPCEHGCKHQLLATMMTLADVPGAEPVPAYLGSYTHMFTLQELPVLDEGRWAPEHIATEHFGGYAWVQHPIGVTDEQARRICYDLVHDVLAGILAAMPDTEMKRLIWQMVIATKVWGEITGLRAARQNGLRIDPAKTVLGTLRQRQDAAGLNPKPLRDDGLGFGINTRDGMADQSTWPAHLRDDAPYQQCNSCGRKTWDVSEFGAACRMRQPDGFTCGGRFREVAT